MIIPPHCKLVYCYFGNGIAFGVYGPKEDITKVMNLLYNHQGHDDETTFVSDNFGYVLGDKEGIKRGIENACVVTLQQQRINLERSERVGIWEEAKKAAEEIWGGATLENFLEGATPGKEYEVWA